MFNLLQSIKSMFSSSKSTYCFEGMGLPTNRNSDFWTDEKVSKMLELFNKNYTYEQVGRAIGATRGQLASKVRGLRKLGIEVKGSSTVKTSSFKVDKATTKPIKSIKRKAKSNPTKQEIDEVIKELK